MNFKFFALLIFFAIPLYSNAQDADVLVDKKFSSENTQKNTFKLNTEDSDILFIKKRRKRFIF